MRIPRLRFRYVGRHRRRHPVRTCARFLRFTLTLTIVAALMSSDQNTAAYAATHDVLAAPQTVEGVVSNVQGWLIGISATVASFFAAVGGLRITASNGDPGEYEKGKKALKCAALGYLVALISPLLVTIVSSWVK